METYPNVDMTWERQTLAPKAKGVGDRLMAQLFAPGGFVAGSGAASWTGDRYQQALRDTGWLYVGVRAICEEIAGLMPQVGFLLEQSLAEDRKRHGRKMLSPLMRRKALIAAQDSDEIEPAPPAHRLVRLLQNPNKPDVSWTFFYRWALYLNVMGNSYIWKVPDAAFGLPIQMYVIPAHWMRAIAGDTELISGFELRPFGGWGGAKSWVIPAKDIIHTALPGPLSLIDGYAPMQATSLWHDVGQSMDVARLAAFKKGVKSDLILTLDPEYANVDDTEISRILALIDKRYSSEANFARVMMLPGGVTALKTERSPAEMDFLTSGDWNRDVSLATNRVGKAIVGITTEVNRASMDASIAQFIRGTIKPQLTLGGQVFTENLAKDFDRRAVIYWPDPTPVDAAQRNGDITVQIANGLMTPNEGRREFGREPYPNGGDDPLIPMGVTPVPWVTGAGTFQEPTGVLEPTGGVLEPLDDEAGLVELDDGTGVPELVPSGNGKLHANRRW
jgi:phage portal protein BeeE